MKSGFDLNPTDTVGAVLLDTRIFFRSMFAGFNLNSSSLSLGELNFFVEQNTLVTTHYGMKLAPDAYGSIDPATIDGVAIFEIRADTADGVSIFMGTGTEQIPNIQTVTFQTISGTYVLLWDGTAYNTSDLTLRDEIVTAAGTSIATALKAKKELPSYISDFNATDATIDQVTCTWGDATGYPIPAYDIYASGILLESNVTSPYVDTFAGTRDYFIKAINVHGSRNSNIDSGTGVVLVFPSANAGIDKTVEVGTLITLTGTSTQGTYPIASYEWSNADGVLSTAISFDYTPDTVEVDTLTFKVTDTEGNASTDTMDLDVTVVYVAPIADAGIDKEVEVDTSITITGIATQGTYSIASYEWRNSGGVLSTTAEFDYTPNTVEIDTLTFKVTDTENNFAEDTMNLTVAYIAPVADAGTDLSIPLAETTTITGIATQGTYVIVSTTWRDGATVLATTEAFEYTPDVPDAITTLSFTVVDTEGNESVDTMIATIGALIAPSANAGVDTVTTVDTPTTITGVGTPGTYPIASYEWRNSDGVIATTAEFTYENAVDDTYVLTLKVTDSEGNFAEDTMSVVVSVVSATALIDYTNASDEFEYTVDVSGNSKVTNQGSSLTVNDLLLHTAENLEVGVTQVYPIPIDTNGDTVVLYNITTASWDYVTGTTTPSYTIPTGTYGHQAVLATEPSTADKAIMEAHPSVLADLFFDRATTLTSIVKADIQHFYTPKIEQGSRLTDLVAPRNAELINNSTFDTGIVGWNGDSGAPIAWDSINKRLECEVFGSGDGAYTTPTSMGVGKVFRAVFDIEFGTYTGATVAFRWSAVAKGSFGEGTKQSIIFSPTSDTSKVGIYREGVNSGTLFIDNFYMEELTDFIEIPNYAETQYTNADLGSVGQQTSNMLFDATCRAIGVDYTKLHFYANSYADTQWNPSLVIPWSLTETIDTVQQVVLDTDNTNENATYLLGKGTYQKVAADPFTAYVQSDFIIEET